MPLFRLVEASQPAPGPVPLKVGGTPSWIAPAAWPACATCGQPMGFRFQLPRIEGALELAPYEAIYVFQCDDPFFRCRPFDARSGANAVIAQRAAPDPFIPPAPQGAVLPEHLLAAVPAREDEAALSIDVDTASPEQLQVYERAQGEAPSSKLGGMPIWLQGPDAPNCCKKPMAFIAQLDGGAWDLPFGDGGAGYVFRCDAPGCPETPFRFSSQSF